MHALLTLSFTAPSHLSITWFLPFCSSDYWAAGALLPSAVSPSTSSSSVSSPSSSHPLLSYSSSSFLSLSGKSCISNSFSIWFVTLMEFNNCFGCPKKWNVFLKLCMWWGGGLTRFGKRKKKRKKCITMKLSVTEILGVSCLLSHSIVLSYVCHLISCKSLSFQKCWQTRALSNLPLWLSKVFTDGPEGTVKI